jgi:hypothetical protein
MFTKENFADSLKHECRVVRHLFEKIPAGSMDFRLTPGQRSTLELLQYLTVIVPASIELVYQGKSDVFGPFVEKSKAVTAENFIAMFEECEKTALETLSKFDSEKLNEVMNVFMMGDKTKGVYLVETILKWIVAYKMQLFLHIKASGNTLVGTSNVWGGMDVPNN